MNVSGPALAYANDHGVELKGMKGTGSEGKITVPDVEKVYKAKLEEEAAAKESDDKDVPEETSKKKPAQTKAKAKKSAVRKTRAAASPLLPTLRQGLAEVKHIKRSLNKYGTGWENEIVSGEQADEKIGEYLTEGWILVHMQSLGITTDGLQMLWIIGKPTEEDLRDWPYREIYHVVQNVGGVGPDGSGLTGFQADAWINSYLDEGWELAYVQAVAISEAGMNMIWVLIR